MLDQRQSFWSGYVERGVDLGLVVSLERSSSGGRVGAAGAPYFDHLSAHGGHEACRRWAGDDPAKVQYPDSVQRQFVHRLSQAHQYLQVVLAQEGRRAGCQRQFSVRELVGCTGISEGARNGMHHLDEEFAVGQVLVTE